MNNRRLALGGHLDRYVASLFAASWATSFLVVVGLFLIMDFAQNFDDFLQVWPDGTQPGTDLVATYYPPFLEGRGSKPLFQCTLRRFIFSPPL